jgi:hypothetical protein
LSQPARAAVDDVHASAGSPGRLSRRGSHARNRGRGLRSAKEPSTGFVVPRASGIFRILRQMPRGRGLHAAVHPNLPVDQLARYWTSGHGKKLREERRTSAECVSCHGSHGMLAVGDPRAPSTPRKWRAPAVAVMPTKSIWPLTGSRRTKWLSIARAYMDRLSIRK